MPLSTKPSLFHSTADPPFVHTEGYSETESLFSEFDFEFVVVEREDSAVFQVGEQLPALPHC